MINEEDIMINDSIDLNDSEYYSSIRPKMLVLGVGGGGVNAVNCMYDSEELREVEFAVVNTDYQSLKQSKVKNKILLGAESRKGLGAGMDPEIGKQSAEESIDEIEKLLDGVKMLFLTAGMGGGTGTGAVPVIAKKAKEMDILVISIVTKPFVDEGFTRMRIAENGIKELKKYTDTLIIIPNQNLDRIANPETTNIEAMEKVNNVLKYGVKGITDLITEPGYINLDFADVQTIMNKHGKAVMGTGEASGENRAERAVEEALSNPLLDNTSIKGAKGIILNITASTDIKYFECNKIRKMIIDEIDNDEVFIIPGNVFDKNLEDTIRVSIFATGIGDETDEDYTGGYNTNQKDVEFDIENVEEAVGPNNNYKKHDNQLSNEQFNIEQQQKQKHNLRKKIGDYQEEDNDFFDMGKTEEFDEYSEKKSTKQNKQNTSKNIDKKQNNQSKKHGFFSSLFNNSDGDKNNDIIIEDDDFDIDVDYYNNTPTYLRKNKK